MEVKGRRYPRILIGKGLTGKIAGVDAYWPDGKKTGVVDISYIGTAVVSHKEPAWDLSKGEKINLELHFLENDVRVPFECEVVRQDDRCTAFHFPNLSVEARKVLQKFMQPKLVGMNTRYVDPKYYIKEQGFNYWYHGPNQTNIFVWGDKKRIKRCTVELEGRVLNIQDQKLYESKSADFLYVATEDYAHQVNNSEDKKLLTTKDSFVKQVVSFIAQVPDAKGILEKVIESINVE